MPYSNGLDQPRAPARAPAHFCTICSRTPAILDGLCAKCWRTQRIDPLRKEENNLNDALLTLRTTIVQHEARLFHEQEIARESQLSERFYCPVPELQKARVPIPVRNAQAYCRARRPIKGTLGTSAPTNVRNHPPASPE